MGRHKSYGWELVPGTMDAYRGVERAANGRDILYTCPHHHGQSKAATACALGHRLMEDVRKKNKKKKS